MQDILNNILNFQKTLSLNLYIILKVIFFTFLLSSYEFIVYKFVSYKTLYNKHLNISIALLPYFISTIILALQSNLVITLGTIGALAIIRYRTAIKDPINMTYILWAVHIGIVCGCQLYELGFITSFIVSIVVLIFEKISVKIKSMICCIKSSKNIEDEFLKIISQKCKSYKIKSRSFANGNFNFIIELRTTNSKNILDEISQLEFCQQVSLVEFDSNNGIL